MNNSFKKIILPLASVNAITLPIVISISAQPLDETSSQDDFESSNKEFSGTFEKNKFINLVKSGSANNTETFFEISPTSNNYQFTGKQKESVRFFTGRNSAYSNVYSNFDNNTGPNIIANPENYKQGAYIIETTPKSQNDLYAISTANKRSWRIILNNYWLPQNPFTNNPGTFKTHFEIPDYTAPSINFGFALSKDLQIANNSLRISVLRQEMQEYTKTNGTDSGGKPYDYKLEKGVDDNYGNSYFFINDKDAINAYANKDVIGMEKGSLNEKVYDNHYFLKQNIIFKDGFTADEENEGFPGVNEIRTLHFGTYNTTGNNVEPLRLLDGISKQGDKVNLSLFNPYLNNKLKDDSDFSTYASSEILSPSNVGTVFYGEVKTALQKYYDWGKYVPTLIIDFDTIENQSNFYDPVTKQAQYVAKDDSPSGITAFYGSNFLDEVDPSFVVSYSKSFERTQARTFKLHISENTVPNYGTNELNVVNQLPTGYGYELQWNGTTIATIPEEEISIAKEKAYNKGTNKFDINLTFNTNYANWPKEIKSYKDLTNPDKLKLVKVWSNPESSDFFVNDNLSSYNDTYISLNPADSKGGTASVPNSLYQNGVMDFYSISKPTQMYGNQKLWTLKQVAEETSIIKLGNSNNVSNGAYKPNELTYRNQELPKAQKEYLMQLINDNWNKNLYVSDPKINDSSLNSRELVDLFKQNSWMGLINDLKQANYDTKKVSEQFNWVNGVISYLENPESPDAVVEINGTKQRILDILLYSKYSSSLPGDSLVRDIANMIFAPTINGVNTRDEFIKAYKEFINIPNMIPDVDLSHNTVVDKNNTAIKIKQAVDNLMSAYNQLSQAGLNSFDNNPVTTKDLLKQANDKLQGSARITSYGQNTFMLLDSRDKLIQYVQLINQITTKYATSLAEYNKYKVVPQETLYSAINKGKAVTTYNAFKQSLDALSNTLTSVNDTYIKETAVLNKQNMEISKLQSINESLTSDVAAKYQAIITDFEDARNNINKLAVQLNNPAFSDILHVWKTNALNELDAIQSLDPSLRLLENYPKRAVSVTAIVNYFDFAIKLANSKSSDFLLNTYETYDGKFSSNLQLANIAMQKGEIDGVSLNLQNGLHPDLPSISLQNNAIAYVIPNTTLDSVYHNYSFQKGINPNNNSKYEFLTPSNKYPATKYFDFLMKNFKKELDTADSVDKISGISAKWSGIFEVLLEKYALLTSDQNLNYAQVGYWLNQYLQSMMNAKVSIAAIVLNAKSAFFDTTSKIDINVLRNISAMKSLKTQIFDKYLDPNSPDNIFKNGKFYSLYNTDRRNEFFDTWNTNELPDDSINTLALIPTILGVLEKTLTDINPLNDKLIPAQSNAPAALRNMWSLQPQKYTWFVYDADKTEQLLQTATQLFSGLNGRYAALNNYVEKVIQGQMKSLFVPEMFSPQLINDLRALIPSKENYLIENDSSYYKAINDKIIEEFRKYVNSLEQLSVESKTAFNVSFDTVFNSQNNYNVSFDTIKYEGLPAKFMYLQLWGAEIAQLISVASETVSLKASDYPYLSQQQIDAFNSRVKYTFSFTNLPSEFSRLYKGATPESSKTTAALSSIPSNPLYKASFSAVDPLKAKELNNLIRDIQGNIAEAELIKNPSDEFTKAISNLKTKLSNEKINGNININDFKAINYKILNLTALEKYSQSIQKAQTVYVQPSTDIQWNNFNTQVQKAQKLLQDLKNNDLSAQDYTYEINNNILLLITAERTYLTALRTQAIKLPEKSEKLQQAIDYSKVVLDKGLIYEYVDEINKLLNELQNNNLNLLILQGNALAQNPAGIDPDDLKELQGALVQANDAISKVPSISSEISSAEKRLQAIIDKINSNAKLQIKNAAEELKKQIDIANSLANNNDIKPLIAIAQDVYDNKDSKTVEEINKQVDILKLANSTIKLQNNLANVNTINDKSDKLTAFITTINTQLSQDKELLPKANAAEYASSKDIWNKNTQTNIDLNNQLDNAIIQEPLVKALKIANKLDTTKWDKTITDVWNKLLVKDNALVNYTINESPTTIQQAVDGLNNYPAYSKLYITYTEASQTVKSLSKQLENFLANIKDIIAATQKSNIEDNNEILKAINNITSLTDETKGIVAVSNNNPAILFESLTTKLNEYIAKNQLLIAIDNATKLVNETLKNLTLINEVKSELTKATTLLNQTPLADAATYNKEATTLNNLAALAKMKQLALNNFDTTYTNLNDAQSTLSKANIIAAVSVQSLTELLSNIQKLNQAMGDLIAYTNSLDPKLLANPISSIAYVYATQNIKTKFDQDFKQVNRVINKKDGIVLSNNDPEAIVDLLNSFKQSVASLNGVDEFTKLLNSLKAQYQAITNKVANPNLFTNTTDALHNAYNSQNTIVAKLITQAEDILKTQSATNTNVTTSLANELNKLATIADEIALFPSNQFIDAQGNKISWANSVLDPLNNLSDTDKQNIKVQFNAAMTYKRAKEILDLAQDQNNKKVNKEELIRDLSKAIKDVLDKDTNTITDDDISNLQDKYKNVLDNGVDKNKVTDYKDLIDALLKLKSLADSYKAFMNSSYNTDGYFEALNNLQTAISSIKPLEPASDPKNQDLINQYNDKLNAEKELANNSIQLVDSLNKNDETKVNQLLQDLNQPIYSDLSNLLKDNNYFNIQSKSIKDITKQDVQNIKSILKSPTYSNLPKVIQTSLRTNIKQLAQNMPWWGYLTIASTLTYVAGLAILVFNKKK
ncbi:hypothetical protein [Mycoplasma seminis]|uniref:ECM-binding protein homolog n=1 Tax=Mycoplasma seminis TaxID=512749 RepID=A0ABY9HBA7_9MOLU|nr:hypothetical protein [Mycoplasma seminis]WLP85870.1 hypothetical protein Q8852_01855 [Mycoplasma seminis]